MSNALARCNGSLDDPGRAAICATLEQIRLIAAQSQLLALNATVESAGGNAAGAPAGEMETLAEQAGFAAAEACRVVSAVEVLLRQIRTDSDYARQDGMK